MLIKTSLLPTLVALAAASLVSLARTEGGSEHDVISMEPPADITPKFDPQLAAALRTPAPAVTTGSSLAAAATLSATTTAVPSTTQTTTAPEKTTTVAPTRRLLRRRLHSEDCAEGSVLCEGSCVCCESAEAANSTCAKAGCKAAGAKGRRALTACGDGGATATATATTNKPAQTKTTTTGTANLSMSPYASSSRGASSSSESPAFPTVAPVES